MRAICLMLLAVISGAAQPANRTRVLTAWYRDGTGLEFYTESNGTGARFASQGSVVVEVGPVVHRVVMAAKDEVLFAYDVEAWTVAPGDTVSIHIAPVSGSGRWSNVPTVAAARDFPAVRRGEAVTLDILYNPASGEMIHDVIRPATVARPPSLSGTVGAASIPAMEDELSLRDVAIRVNGVSMRSSGGWLVGQAMRVYIPGHGSYLLSAKPAAGVTLEQAAQVDGGVLRITSGPDRIELTSVTNILTKSDRGTIWVYHDPKFTPSGARSDAVDIVAADKAEWLIPRKH